jgi:hypothetical protein
LRLRVTHLLLAGASPDRPPDLLAADETGKRFFLPGWLPCGECGPCRRGWVAACPRGHALAGAGAALLEATATERFATPVDDPPGTPALADAPAACAGVVAQVQELAARAGLGSGDLAVWIGDDALTTLGARLSATRGCATFQLTTTPALEPSGAGVTVLRVQDGHQSWTGALAAAAAAAPGGFLERRLFVARADSPSVDAAVALVAPGATLSFLDGSGGAALRPQDLPSTRVLIADPRAYHPDLVPEALATLRREPALVQDLIVEPASGAAAGDPGRLTLLRA